MNVVADATPIHYLILIGEIDLLRQLYGTIEVPEAVIAELSAPRAPTEVRAWASVLPVWAAIGRIPGSGPLPFEFLGLGERQAIAIASESGEGILLTDDFRARVAAESVGIRVIPTIRVLSTAADLALVGLKDALERLQRTNFRVSQKVIDAVIARGSVKSSG